MDNKTSQKAKEYDKNVTKTHELYNLFHKESLKLIRAVNPKPTTWLDAGGGTGQLIKIANQEFENVKFTLTDPSPSMIEVAKTKFKNDKSLQIEYVNRGSEEEVFQANSFDVITAILSHHYFDEEDRKTASLNCFKILKPGGLYINFETILPRTGEGIKIGLDRWYKDQINNGKDEKKVKKHIDRFGSQLLPITIQAHIKLLELAGFKTVELFWLSGMQAGFYAIK